MASDYMPDDFIETYEDSPPLEGYDGRFEPVMDGSVDHGGSFDNIGRVAVGPSNDVSSDSTNFDRDRESTSGSSRISSVDEVGDGSHGKTVEVGSDRNGKNGNGSVNRGGRNRGSSKEVVRVDGSATAEQQQQPATPAKPRAKRVRSDNVDGSEGKPAKSRKKSDSAGVSGDGARRAERTANAKEIVAGPKSNVQRSNAGGRESNVSSRRREQSPAREAVSFVNADETSESRHTRYITNLLAKQDERNSMKDKAFTASKSRVDLIALDEKIREVKGMKCHALDAFIICNKVQLVCYSVFIDGEGKVSVGTRELEKNYRGLIENNPNLDVMLTDDMKAHLVRKWWKVPAHMHKKILEAQNQSVIQHNGERFFTMTLTGYYCGSMVDGDTGERRVTFMPNLTFMPYKALLEE